MGGGTTCVEALQLGRRSIGNDLNPLAVFVTRVKTTPLSRKEIEAVREWAERIISSLKYTVPKDGLLSQYEDRRLRNMRLPTARFIKKITAQALRSIECLPTQASKEFVRCSVLRTCQWALDGRRTHTALKEFRLKLNEHLMEMLAGISDFRNALRAVQSDRRAKCYLREGDASTLHEDRVFGGQKNKVSLVVTSPPYPGVHVLYHRWQVDGRRETPAPYWIADCNDGQGASFYNFGDRHQKNLEQYFESSIGTLRSVRRVMRDGAFLIQMLAFSDPENQMPRYLDNVRDAGFNELLPTRLADGDVVGRIWRSVPGRKWYAALKGETQSSREVVLVHRAV
jgi:hypothetical protein